jgi:hypothetical protein
MGWICPECGYENDDYLIKCICGYEDKEEREGEDTVKQQSVSERICNSFEVVKIKENHSEIALISIVVSFCWIFSWVGNRWFMLPDVIFVAFILGGIFCFSPLFSLLLAAIPNTFIRYFIILTFATVIALITFKFTFGVVKSRPIMTTGKVVDKRVEERTGTTGPGGGFIIHVNIIEVVSEEPEFVRFNLPVRPADYPAISIGDHMKIIYHTESISIFKIFRKRTVLDSINVHVYFGFLSKLGEVMSLIIGFFPLLS